ncbi:hypothetical protein BO78DRAFT_415401 [Aspergillus sclerotiicarbonarius CBS 121057]|uniref:Zn(2)-C6 fungal-type domain-containing protein n=1 Tax=Aspergillus sclerotiicarbonarius (strain CBS 121057 / IBT 28362) TaxID=1448318 RepID=A0A319EQF2_ASPSB|nr:hypothetical protein BO78DRAFT_415401 [Aspergillus sclerotiicarbonarius CBS 121057]
MKNVRIDLLPPDRQLAMRDCRVCIKRRIKCDRSTPHCRKCTIRGLDCPGFDFFHVRWAQGIASRGKLVGKVVPVLSQERSEIPQGHLTDNWNASAYSLSGGGDPISHPITETGLVRSQLSLALCDQLVNHFDSRVAALFTWVDSPDNPWRKIVLPLAQRFTCLRLSILHLAAAHLSATSAGDMSPIHQVNHHLRESTFRTLNQEIQREIDSRASKTPDHLSLTRILITAVGLCYAELLTPNSADWNLHLRACRTIMDRHGLRSGQDKPLDFITRFVIKEVGDIEVFGNVFSFSSLDIASTLPMTRSDFWTFSRLIHEVTALERQRYGLIENGRQPPHVNMSIWRAKLEQAYSRLSSFEVTSVLTQDETTQTCFRALIHAHYHASIIYTYQALAPPAETMEAVASSLPVLFDEIQRVTRGIRHAFSHDVFFPLFIAGTECWGERHRQETIGGLFLMLLSATGMWCNHRALAFLQDFWSSPESHGTGKWIQYARESANRIAPFLVF